MNWIDVISAGPGRGEMLTQDARKAIAEADAVFCADRYAFLAEAGKRLPLMPMKAAMDSLEELNREGKHAAVLLSGDAGLYSLLPALKKRFDAPEGAVERDVAKALAELRKIGALDG